MVNRQGQLIGINTAILSGMRSYADIFCCLYQIVKKIFDNLVKYWEFQKAFIGADFLDIDSKIAKDLQLDNFDGVILDNVQKEVAADNSLLKREILSEN